MGNVEYGELAALATALCFTLSAVAWTSAGKHIGSMAVSFHRLWVACLLMCFYGGLRHGQWLPTDADAKTWLFLGASGFCGFFLCDICLFKAMLLIGPRLTLLIFSLSPPITAAISWVFGIDSLAGRDWLAMTITLAGVVWVVLEQPERNGRSHAKSEILAVDTTPGVLATEDRIFFAPRGHRTQGIALAIASALAFSVGTVFAKEGIGTYDAVGATLIRALAALPGYFVLITLLRRWPAMRKAMNHHKAMTQLTLGAIIGPFTGVALNMVALQYVSTGVVATIIATTPVMIIPLSILLYGDKVSLRAAGGAIIAVLGVAMLVRPWA